MKEFDLDNDEMQLLKAALLSFVERVAGGRVRSLGELQVFPEIVKLLLGHFDCLSCAPIYGVAEEDGKEHGA